MDQKMFWNPSVLKGIRKEGNLKKFYLPTNADENGHSLSSFVIRKLCLITDVAYL
jgi:hypothetical protein